MSRGTPRKISQRGVDFLKREEGCVLHPYICPAGKWTIGYGHVFPDPEQRHALPRITMEQAEALLRFDLTRFEAGVNRLITVPLTQGQFDALVSLTFNIGLGKKGFSGSTLRRLLNAGDYAGAREQFSVWRIGGGKVLPVLVARRRREVTQLWDAPDEPNPPAVPVSSPTTPPETA